MGFDARVELSLCLTGDAEIQALNRLWRGKDRATDVLSFSQLEGEALPTGVVCLGDVVISYDTAARQAAARQLSLMVEVERLLVHGILHLLGHDHEQGGAPARRMQAEEGRLLRRLRAADLPSGPGIQ